VGDEVDHTQGKTLTLSRATEATDMPFIVHAEHNGEPVQRGFASAFDAIREAWRLLAEGAIGVYIFDDETNEAFAPDRFSELYR
jgi:hypothetical protein